MRRRDFILAGCATIAWPLAARAQKARRTYRLGGLSAGPRDTPYFVAMFETLYKTIGGHGAPGSHALSES